MLKSYTKVEYINPKTFIILVIGAFVLSVCSQCSGSETVQLSKAEIEAKLFALKPLPKVHYSWWIESTELLQETNERLCYEYARITHALSVAGDWVTEEHLDRCVYICARVNKSEPKILCSIGVNYSPWHRRFGKELPPTNRGPSYYAEIDFFTERMKKVKSWVAKANEKYDSKVEVSALLLGNERLLAKPGDEVWNEGMRQALDAIHVKAKSIFPKARIQWWNRGMAKQGRIKWVRSPYFTGKEIKSPLSCSFFSVPELDTMREKFRKTCQLADELGIEEAGLGLALAAGYRRGLKESKYWDWDWDYDLIYSYQIGAELNIPWYSRQLEGYAPYDRVKIISFYPAPFNSKSPAWAKHFIAYVRGATDVKNLTDLGYDK